MKAASVSKQFHNDQQLRVVTYKSDLFKMVCRSFNDDDNMLNMLLIEEEAKVLDFKHDKKSWYIQESDEEEMKNPLLSNTNEMDETINDGVSELGSDEAKNEDNTNNSTTRETMLSLEPSSLSDSDTESLDCLKKFESEGEGSNESVADVTEGPESVSDEKAISEFVRGEEPSPENAADLGASSESAADPEESQEESSYEDILSEMMKCDKDSSSSIQDQSEVLDDEGELEDIVEGQSDEGEEVGQDFSVNIPKTLRPLAVFDTMSMTLDEDANFVALDFESEEYLRREEEFYQTNRRHHLNHLESKLKEVRQLEGHLSQVMFHIRRIFRGTRRSLIMETIRLRIGRRLRLPNYIKADKLDIWKLDCEAMYCCMRGDAAARWELFTRQGRHANNWFYLLERDLSIFSATGLVHPSVFGLLLQKLDESRREVKEMDEKLDSLMKNYDRLYAECYHLEHEIPEQELEKVIGEAATKNDGWMFDHLVFEKRQEDITRCWKTYQMKYSTSKLRHQIIPPPKMEIFKGRKELDPSAEGFLLNELRGLNLGFVEVFGQGIFNKSEPPVAEGA